MKEKEQRQSESFDKVQGMRAEENKVKEKNKERQCLHQSRGKGCKEQGLRNKQRVQSQIQEKVKKEI